MQENIIKSVLDELRDVLIKNEDVIVEHIYQKHIRTAFHPEDGSPLGLEEILTAMRNAIRDAYHCGCSDFKDYIYGK